jgi:competence protein ComEC
MRPSYDFGRDMYFQGIGASGFAMGAIKTVEAPGSGGLSAALCLIHCKAYAMRSMREFGPALDGDQRAIATALLTGRRDAISAPVNVYFRPRTRALDIGISHGGCRRRGVRAHGAELG